MRHLTVAVIAAALLAGGCARGSGRLTDRSARPLPPPPAVFVYPFAVDATDVVVDIFGEGFLRESPTSSEQYARARSVAESLAAKLVEALTQRGVPARLASGPPPLNALLVKGQFLTIDEGDQLKRVVVGMGMGAQEVRVQVQVHQQGAGVVRQVEAGEASSEGRMKPGMAIPVASAAAGASAVGAVISGGYHVMTESSGKLDADLGRLAARLADRAAEFYREQGWH